MGDVVLTSPGRAPAYAKDVAWVKEVLAIPIPPFLGSDPFGRLRIADEEIDDLVTEVDDWLRVGSHVRNRTVIRRTIPTVEMVQTEHRTEFDDPPGGWAHRTTRIVADLRSQLDHVVFQLVTRAAPHEMTERELRNLSFPIDDSERPLSIEKFRQKLPFISDASLEEILAAQPSRVPEGIVYGQSCLWMLNKLNNLDKHRALNVAATAQVISRGPNSQVYGEGELLVPAEDILGNLCEEGCLVDTTVVFGVAGATQFLHGDGTVEPAVGLCRFLRDAFALVGRLTYVLLVTEGVIDEWEQALDRECATTGTLVGAA